MRVDAGGYGVAPHAGAWIEISRVTLRILGLIVAPHAGAWIEIASGPERTNRGLKSHPMRVRGLKYDSRADARTCMESHPMRVRGLK